MSTTGNERQQASTNSANAETSSTAAVISNTIRLPEFWERNPSAWFIQAEARFELSRITSQTRKYLLVVDALPAAVIDEISDLLHSFAHDLPESPYDVIKAAILDRTAMSERTRLQQLLSIEQLGNQRPSQLLRRFLNLLGPRVSTTDSTFVRELFLQRLPTQVQMVLATASTQNLSELATLADKVMEVANPLPVVAAAIPASASHAVSPSLTKRSEPASPSFPVAELCDRLEKLLVATTRRSASPPSRRRRRSPSYRRFPSIESQRNSESQQSDICWYHRRFGARARRCLLPCTWSENRPADR